MENLTNKEMLDISICMRYPARIIEYADYDENEILKCPVCDWQGTPKDHIGYYNDLFDVCCPNCEKMLLIVSYP